MAIDVKGKTVVITGAFDKLSREEGEAGLKKLGARVTGSVSKKTDFLVVGVASGSKLERAQELGVQTLTEKQMRKALGL